jgi:hypothetical protein
MISYTFPLWLMVFELELWSSWWLWESQLATQMVIALVSVPRRSSLQTYLKTNQTMPPNINDLLYNCFDYGLKLCTCVEGKNVSWNKTSHFIWLSLTTAIMIWKDLGVLKKTQYIKAGEGQGS